MNESYRDEQEYQEHMQFCYHCETIAHDWLMAKLTEAEAIEALLGAQDSDGLLYWAEIILSDPPEPVSASP